MKVENRRVRLDLRKVCLLYRFIVSVILIEESFSPLLDSTAVVSIFTNRWWSETQLLGQRWACVWLQEYGERRSQLSSLREEDELLLKRRFLRTLHVPRLQPVFDGDET